MNHNKKLTKNWKKALLGISAAAALAAGISAFTVNVFAAEDETSEPPALTFQKDSSEEEFRGQMPKGGPGMGQRPEMGEMPEGMTPPEMGEMPEGMTPPEMGEMPEGMTPPEMGEMPDGTDKDQLRIMPDQAAEQKEPPVQEEAEDVSPEVSQNFFQRVFQGIAEFFGNIFSRK